MPSDSSQMNIEMVAIAANTVTGSLPRNSVAVAEGMSRGAPMSPSTGMRRGTRPDRYIKFSPLRGDDAASGAVTCSAAGPVGRGKGRRRQRGDEQAVQGRHQPGRQGLDT